MRLAAARDGDSTDDSATLTVSAPAVSSEAVAVAVTDEGDLDLVLSTTTVSVDEGASTTFTVRLDAVPSSPVTVTIARTAGDADVDVSGGASLTFDVDNWDTARTVTIGAADDADTVNDTATLTVSAPSLASRTVTVTVSDDELMAPAITSTADTTAIVGALYRYDVAATGLPAPTFALTTMPAGMSIDEDSGLISWTPGAAGDFPVVVVASNGVAPDATQSFTIDVGADQPPQCTLTRPTAGETVSGQTAEFFGDGSDDVGTVKAEFFLDDVLRSTDTNTTGHYHYGSAHNKFDTTVFADGAHQARMTITDTAGATCSAAVAITIANLPDAGVPDAASPDARLPDAASPDARLPDAASPDAASPDAASPDAAGAPDAVATPDAAGAPDAGATPDARSPDAAGATDAAVASEDLTGGACDCRVAGPRAPGAGWAFLLALGLALLRRRRR